VTELNLLVQTQPLARSCRPHSQFLPRVLGIVLRQVVELREYDTANPDKPSAPFAVNQVVHGSNGRLREDLDMCMEFELPIVIISLGAKNSSTRQFIRMAVSSCTT